MWHVKPTFWLPGDCLLDRAKADRVPYDVWHKDERLETTPGPTVDYEYVAHKLFDITGRLDLRRIAFDRWNWKYLKPWLLKAGFHESQVEGDAAIFEEFGQGTASMSPALRDLETLILNKRIAHGDHPVLNMCMMNVTVKPDPAGNRKFDKQKIRGRIDGAVALAMATAMAGTYEPADAAPYSPWDDPNFSLMAA